MIRWYNVPNNNKVAAYTTIGGEKGMPSYAVEKDWWVVQTLAIIFEMKIGKHLVFKGGTSLSKAWGLIDRFSEDIDLAVSPTFFGFEDPLTKTQIKTLRKNTSSYLSTIFYPALQSKFTEKGLVDVKVEMAEVISSDQDPRIIIVHYPSVFGYQEYVQPKVQIEIGCRSLRDPFSSKSFSSFVDEYYPDAEFTQTPICIPVVNRERTFLEKIFLLHEEFQRPQDKIRVDRLSRHLYDIYQLSKTDFAEEAIGDQELYETIVNHRYKFNRISGVDYKKHQPQSINPIPPTELIVAWKADYKTMQEQMIYGDSPNFETMLQTIRELRDKINRLGWEMENDF